MQMRKIVHQVCARASIVRRQSSVVSSTFALLNEPRNSRKPRKVERGGAELAFLKSSNQPALTKSGSRRALSRLSCFSRFQSLHKSKLVVRHSKGVPPHRLQLPAPPRSSRRRRFAPLEHLRDDFFQRRILDAHVVDRMLRQDGRQRFGDHLPVDLQLYLGALLFDHFAKPG